MKWFRLYDEILDDPKMMALSAKEFQTWILLLCLANRETAGKRGEICRDFATISRQLHGENRTISQILKRFIELGLIQENGKSIRIVNWDKRQFKSDDVLQRVKRYRNVTVTAPDTDTDTDTEKDKDIVVKDDIAKIPFREIVEHLNLRTGMSFRASTKQTQTLIRARWKEGFRVDDFKKVIDRMYDSWGADSKMMQYLRPITLFGTKFEGYLNKPEKRETDGEPF
jgi:uncharacterized phage protein (TIGR02220 family)